MMDDIVDAQVDLLRVGRQKHWKHEMEERGVRGAWPDLVKESGGEVPALRTMTRALKGAYVGPTIDPDTGRPDGPSAVLDLYRSKLYVGPPGTGKSTRMVIPVALQGIAAGMRSIMPITQPKTLADIYRAALAVGDSSMVTILDFGGLLVPHESSRRTTWDPTSRCVDPQAAREFGRKLAGPGSPVADDLGKGNGASFWLQIPEVAASVAAHLVQVERQMKRQTALSRGMSPADADAYSLRGGRTGISGVFDYMRRPLPPDPARKGTPFEGLTASLRSELTPAQLHALRDQPAQIRAMQQNLSQAAYNAALAPLSLQKLVYNRALLELQDAPVDVTLAGEELEELFPIIENIAKRESDPLDQLGRAVKQAVTEPERETLSPRPGDLVVTAQEIVEGPSGLFVVGYDSAGSSGLAPGWFCDEVLKAAFRHSKQLPQGAEWGGLSIDTDEAGAYKYVDTGLALKEGRQHKIVANLSVTSLEQLVDEMGPEKANTVIKSSPQTALFAPTSAQAAEISESFGKKTGIDVTRSYQSDSAGSSTSVAEHKVPRVDVDRIKNLDVEKGEVVITDTAGTPRKDNIVRAFAFHERNNPVGETIAAVERADGPNLPWTALLPDAQRRLEEKHAARQLPKPELPEQRRPGALRRLPDVADIRATTAAPEPPTLPAPLPEPRPDPTDF